MDPRYDPVKQTMKLKASELSGARKISRVHSRNHISLRMWIVFRCSIVENVDKTRETPDFENAMVSRNRKAIRQYRPQGNTERTLHQIALSTALSIRLLKWLIQPIG